MSKRKTPDESIVPVKICVIFVGAKLGSKPKIQIDNPKYITNDIKMVNSDDLG